MNRLEEIVDSVAFDLFGEETALSVYRIGTIGMQERFTYECMERYARECCIATQKACAENATMIKRKNQKHTKGIKYYTGENRDLEIVIESESITNKSNIVLL